MRADIRRKQADFDGAIADYTEAFKPDYAEAYFNRASVRAGLEAIGKERLESSGRQL